MGKSERVIPKPVAPDPDLLPALADQLAAIASLEGTADLSAVEKQYGEWYGQAKERFGNQPNSALADPFFNRLRGELLKLAVIFEVSQSGTTTVTEAAFKRAVAVVTEAEETIFKLLPSGMTREGAELERMSEKICNAGPEGISKTELTRAFLHVKQRDRDERLNTLVGSGRVQNVVQKTAGRPVQTYVHQDHLAEEQKE